ncbi:hypothetical protein QWJ34_24875 [Saccharibacillus sp. CPCC 101409]|uniref:hypothetical protein n=1 Tax=Saccharibacillus sp. CPCC 101409 TaxID=3058041 RepID=UPI002672CFEC|nr:hypothetical protein [Saccharibacillus sp. CPCC 101409]MDO3413021.1 hypothetical protein [Saccharibacillus sp. CPCC 101409]
MRSRPLSSIAVFGGSALILSAVLFFAQYLFLAPVPPAPAAAEYASWLSQWRFRLSMADEVLFFASVGLIPAAFGLYRALIKHSPVCAPLGCGLLGAAASVELLLVVVLGRLVYPVYGIEPTPDTGRLMYILYVGGEHTALLLFGLATLSLSLAARRSGIGRLTVYSGYAIAALDWVASFPWLLGDPVLFVLRLAFAAWLALLGARLIAISRRSGRLNP